MTIAQVGPISFDYAFDVTVNYGWTLGPPVVEPFHHGLLGNVHGRTLSANRIRFHASGSVSTTKPVRTAVQIGFVQIVLRSKREATYNGLAQYKLKMPNCPHRDGGESAMDPWYSKRTGSEILAFTDQMRTKKFDIEVTDQPRFAIPVEYCPPGNAGGHFAPLPPIINVLFDDAFATFLAANVNGRLVFLHRVNWDVNIVGPIERLHRAAGARVEEDFPLVPPAQDLAEYRWDENPGAEEFVFPKFMGRY